MAERSVRITTPPTTASDLALGIMAGLLASGMTYTEHIEFLVGLVSELDEVVMDLEFTRQVANRFTAIVEREED